MNEGLLKSIDEIKDILFNMQKMEAARAEREMQTKADVESLKKAVNGNGDGIGMKTDVQILKKDMARVYWLGGAILIAVIGQILAMWL